MNFSSGFWIIFVFLWFYVQNCDYFYLTSKLFRTADDFIIFIALEHIYISLLNFTTFTWTVYLDDLKSEEKCLIKNLYMKPHNNDEHNAVLVVDMVT